MKLISVLYTVLSIVGIFNVVTTTYCSISKVKVFSSDDEKTNNVKKTCGCNFILWLVIKIISSLILILLAFKLIYFYNFKFIALLFMILLFLSIFNNAIPSAEMVSNIVRGKHNKKFGLKENTALITLACILIFLKSFGISDKFVEFANSLDNYYYSDWMLVGFYVISISISTFFISSLALNPVKFIIKLIKKFFSSFRKYKSKLSIEKLEKQVNGSCKTETWTSSAIEHSVSNKILLLLLPITFILDILRLTLLFLYESLVSIFLYLLIIVFYIMKIVSKIANWILSLSDSKIVSISFRIAVVLGFGCTVIINRYEPIFKIQETTTVLEFISSTIIIPVILEWILSYKTKSKKTS